MSMIKQQLKCTQGKQKSKEPQQSVVMQYSRPTCRRQTNGQLVTNSVKQPAGDTEVYIGFTLMHCSCSFGRSTICLNTASDSDYE